MPTPLLTAEVGPARLEVVVADITTLAVDAIVNAANTSLLGGGGVDGAIHRAAGPSCSRNARRSAAAPPARRRSPAAIELPAQHVIHAVGPVWSGGSSGEADLLASCYRTALDACGRHGLRSIAFPAISTGVYRFPADRAARIAVGTVVSELSADARGHRARGVLLLLAGVGRAPHRCVRGTGAGVAARASTPSDRRRGGPPGLQAPATPPDRSSSPPDRGPARCGCATTRAASASRSLPAPRPRL